MLNDFGFFCLFLNFCLRTQRRNTRRFNNINIYLTNTQVICILHFFKHKTSTKCVIYFIHDVTNEKATTIISNSLHNISMTNHWILFSTKNARVPRKLNRNRTEWTGTVMNPSRSIHFPLLNYTDNLALSHFLVYENKFLLNFLSKLRLSLTFSIKISWLSIHASIYTQKSLYRRHFCNYFIKRHHRFV